MYRITWALGAAALLAAAIGPSYADDAGYDLRGPAPTKGQTLVHKATFKVKDADITLKVGDKDIQGKQTLTVSSEEEIKVLLVDGRQAKKVQTKVLKEKVDTVTTLGGEDMKESKPGELDTEVIISERTGPGKWTHTLADKKPTDKQKKDLNKRVGPENEDDIYPEGKVKVGHTWTVDAASLQRIFGGSITDLKGKLNMKFVKIEEVDGEECAVIEAKGTIKGIAKEDEGDLNVELELNGTTWRSIKTGVDLKDKAKGKIKMSGKLEMDGAKVEITLEGPLTIESTSRIKESK